MAAAPSPSVRIGVFGPEESNSYDFRGCALCAPGYQAALTAAGAASILLSSSDGAEFCEDSLEDLHGLVFVGDPALSPKQLAEAERVCEWCRARDLPLLAVDNGLLVLNLVHGGTIFND